MDQIHIKKELDRWMAEVVETPNPALGNWAPCPYARQARVNNKIEIVFCKVSDLHNTLHDSLLLLDNKEVVVICFDHKDIGPTEIQEFRQSVNNTLMPNNYVVLEGHPDLPEYVSGIRLNFDACATLIVQKLDALTAAADKLQVKGYYDHWDSTALDNIVNWRQLTNKS